MQNLVTPVSPLTEEQKETAQKRVSRTEIMTTETTTNRDSQTSVDNPFARRLHAKLKGQYVSPSVATDRNMMKHEDATRFEEARIKAIRDKQPHPPF